MFKQFLFLVALSVGGCMAGFFPEDNSTVKWEHAVNSKEKLQNVLKKDGVLMLEADVSLSNTSVPIMAHPPNNTSDLTLDEFLNTVLNAISKKGIKLDFKSTPAFNASVPFLNKYVPSYQNKSIPVWLNADILMGSGGQTPEVDQTQFLANAKTFNTCTLSLGWTTSWTGTENYTMEDVRKMNESLKTANIMQPVTFAVRAALASKTDVGTFKSLVSIPHSSLTVWSSELDKNITYSTLRKIIDEIGRKHIFIDLPSDQLKALNSGIKPVLSSACVLLAVGISAFRFW